jgi:hypothetical protein
MNEEIDQFLLYFPWSDCRIYHNVTMNDSQDDKTTNWKEIVLSCLPVDCEYLIKATYTDAVTIVSEYILFKTQEKKYHPSISEDYLLYVISKCKESKAESSYTLLLAQVFLAYFHFFHHEELYRSFCNVANFEEPFKEDSATEDLKGLFAAAIDELQGVLLHPRNPNDSNKKNRFLNEVSCFSPNTPNNSMIFFLFSLTGACNHK